MPSMFRPRVLAAGLCLATAVALAAAAVLRPAPAGAQAGDDSVALAEVMLTRLNEVRRDNGLAPYRVNPILTRIAFEHARDIAAHTMYSHTGSDGRKAKQRAIDAGYGAGRAGLRIGENFVARQHLDDGFQWLMDDPPHRANMLDPKFREVGVGAARMSYGYVWVMDLGWYEGIDDVLAAPPTAVPPADAVWAAIVLGVLCTGVAYLLYFRLVADVGPTRALTVTFLIPVFGMLWGALFLGEAITAPMLAGAALVLVGTGMILGVGARRAAAPAAAPRASGTERGERATAPNRATPPGRRR